MWVIWISQLALLFALRCQSNVLFSKHITQIVKYLLMASKACWKNWESMLCSRLRIIHCSSVIPIPVRSLALLQLMKRHPFNRQQICNQKKTQLNLDGCRGLCQGQSEKLNYKLIIYMT